MQLSAAGKIGRAVGMLVIASVMSGCSTAPAKPKVIQLGDYSYAKTHLTDRIEKLMTTHGLPGFAVALVDDQSVVWQKAFGLSNVEKESPMTTSTPFKAGSIAKLFTGLEIMRLSEEGLVDLDAPITDYLPEFSIKTRFPNTDPITIRSILAHRSGLPRNGNLPLWYWDPGTDVLQELVASLAHSHAAFPPGCRYKYSNVAFDLLGHVIDETRSVQFPYYMKHKYLLDPIGMSHSAFLLEDITDPQRVVMGYLQSDGQPKAPDQYDIISMPSGNLYSNVEDLCEFVKFVLRGGGLDGQQLIEKQTLESMFEVQYAKPRDPQRNGLAWFTDVQTLSEKVVFHSGTIQGTISVLAMIPEKRLGVVLMSNAQAFEDLAAPIAFDVLELMLETKCGLTPLGRFCGKYIVDGEVMEIIVRGNKLKARVRGHEVELVPLSNRKFQLKHWLADIGRLDVGFFVGDNDEADIMLLTVEGSFHITCPKYPPVESVPSLWHELAGKYSEHPRIKSSYSDADVLGEAEISIVDNVLVMPDLKAALWPISRTEILLVGGIFDGETMQYGEEAGSLTRQNMIYRRMGRQ